MIVLKALLPLRFSHENGIIHGNIKPTNLLIDKTGRVVLSDFGISQVKAHGFISPNANGDFTTPLFISPEQTNQVAEQAGFKSDLWKETSSIILNDVPIDLPCAISEQGLHWDIWSVGVLLYRVCSGYYPFYDTDLANLLTSIKHSEPTKILDLVNDLPPPIAAVIEQCLQKEPDQRPPSLDPIINILQQYFTSQGVSNIDEIIAAFMQEKMSMSEISAKPETLSDNTSHTEPIATIRDESQWEFIEYKTISSATRFNSGISPLSSPHSRFTRPVIVMITVAFLVVLGTFIFKKNTEKLNQLTDATQTNIQDTYVPPVKPEVQVENPAVVPVQDSVMMATKPAIVTALPDSRTSAVPLPAQVKPTKHPQIKPVRPVAKATSAKNTVKINPDDLPGILNVTINPPEAQVFIDGTLMTQNEMTNGMRVSQGNYTISAKATGYMTYERPIRIESNKTLQLSLELKSNAKGNGQLHIYSYPWANLYVDDQLIGTTPTPSPISLVEGNHKVVLSRDGYKQYEGIVNVENGGISRLQIQLKKTENQ
jgi:serine/threonine protein kinase